METEFRVGDICDYLGLRVVIMSTEAEEVGVKPICARADNGFTYYFCSNGKLLIEHTQPALRLIERPKRKVKKRFYMMACRDSAGAWYIPNRLVDESFKDTASNDVLDEHERKIMENSPYIELDLEVSE